MDAKTLAVVGDVTVGGGKRVSVTGNENKDQLVMGIGAAILLLAGSAKGGSAAGASAASSPKTSQTPHGYSVNGQHFDSFGEAALYVKQFSYMDNSWIKPESPPARPLPLARFFVNEIWEARPPRGGACMAGS